VYYLFNQGTVFIGICKNCSLHSKQDLKLVPESKASKAIKKAKNQNTTFVRLLSHRLPFFYQSTVPYMYMYIQSSSVYKNDWGKATEE